MVFDILFRLAIVILISLVLFAASVAIGVLLSRLGLDEPDEVTVEADLSPSMLRGGTAPGRR
jgi:hypothetical protein